MLSTQECLLAVTVHVPPVRSFKSLMVAGKKDACLYTVRHGICVSCLECPLLCLGGAGINLKLMTTPLPWRTVWPVWQLSCDVGERAAAVHSILNSCVLDSCNHCCCCCTKKHQFTCTIGHAQCLLHTSRPKIQMLTDIGFLKKLSSETHHGVLQDLGTSSCVHGEMVGNPSPRKCTFAFC